MGVVFQVWIVGSQEYVDEVQVDGQFVQGQYQVECYQYQYGEQCQCGVVVDCIGGQWVCFGVFYMWVELVVGVVVDDVIG